MKASTVILSLALSPLFANVAGADCSAPTQTPITDKSACKNGEMIISSMVRPLSPGEEVTRCGVPQMRFIQSCFDRQGATPSVEEFISFANDQKNNPEFLNELAGIKLIPSATKESLDEYLTSLSSKMKKSATFDTLVLHDDGVESEFKSLQELTKRWDGWRKKNSTPASEALNSKVVEELSAQTSADLKKFTSVSCESPQAKELFNKIQVPVIRFSDNVEQIVWPVETPNSAQIGSVLIGRPNNSGIFSRGSNAKGLTQVNVSIIKENGKVYYRNHTNASIKEENGKAFISVPKYEIESVRKISLKEATKSVHHFMDICQAQGFLKTLPASAPTGNAGSNTAPANSNATQ